MEEMVSRAREVAKRAASREEILPFLRLCAANSNLSLLNQLLVYEQCPGAKTVCGKFAWKQLGRTVKKDAVPVQILLPDVSLEKVVGCRVVNVYDYDSTEGASMPEWNKKPAFADRITQITGATWEIVPEAAMKGGLDRGHYDGEKHIFYLAEQGAGQQEETILGLYVDYVMDSWEHKDMLVKFAVTFLLYERYGLKHTIVSALFGKLGRMTAEEKWAFLKNVRCTYKKMLDDLEGHTLDFNETAFVNSLLVSSESDVVNKVFEQAAEKSGNEELREELLVLKEKLLQTRKGYLEELYRKRCQRQLFSFPPVALEMETVDMFREERLRYGAEGIRDFADAGRER